MKRLTFFILMLALGFSSIHAQESAFEELLPFRVDWLNASFCRETTDGHFIVAPGSECRVLKILQDGKVVDEMTYRMDTVNNFWTWFGQLIDIPNDPSHYLAIAEMYDDVKECHNLFHIVKIDENLAYDPDEVIVVDLSEEVRHFWIESDPHFVIDGEGNLCFATVAKKWDDTYCLMYVKVTPEGEKTVVYDQNTGFVNGGEVCAFVPCGDHYMMMAGYTSNFSPYERLCQYEVSLDFVSDSICYSMASWGSCRMTTCKTPVFMQFGLQVCQGLLLCCSMTVISCFQLEYMAFPTTVRLASTMVLDCGS